MLFNILKRKLLSRDIKALEELFNMFYESVYKSAFFITRDKMMAEDVTQDTFIQAYEKIEQLRNASRVEFWLIRIAMNKARDQLRKNKRQISVAETQEQACSLKNEPDSKLIDQEDEQIINNAIDHLKQEYQEVLYLKYYRDFTTKQIAEILLIPEGTVKTRLRKARGLLKNALSRSENGGELDD